MSFVFSKESQFAAPAHRIMVGSVSILFGCLGFMLSVITAVIHFFFPALLRPRAPLKSNTISRASSRQTFRRQDGTKYRSVSAGRGSSFSHSADRPSSSDSKPPKSPKSPKSPHTLELPLAVSTESRSLPEYFPLMSSSPTSEVPHVVVTKSSLDEVRSSRLTQQLENTSKKPNMTRSSTTGTDCMLRGSRSMSFFRSRGHQRVPSDPSITPPSDPIREKEKKKKKPQATRQRTQPYEAPYFFPVPIPPSTEHLRPRPEPVRSHTMPPPQRKVL